MVLQLSRLLSGILSYIENQELDTRYSSDIIMYELWGIPSSLASRTGLNGNNCFGIRDLKCLVQSRLDALYNHVQDPE